MKILELLLLTTSIILITSKTIKKDIILNTFHQDGPFIFLTKFHLSTKVNQFDINYYKGNYMPSQFFYDDLSIGLVNQTMFEQFRNEKNCQNKVNLLYKRQKLRFREERHGMKHVKLFDLPAEQIWYFYIFSCHGDLPQLKQTDEKISMQFSILDNRNHFGPYQYSLIGYVVVIIIWLIIVIKFSDPIGSILILNNADSLKLSIFIGFLLLGAGYLYKLIHLIIIFYDGYGIPAFQIIYLILKLLGEALIVAIIISLAWGWTITNLNPNKIYFIIGAILCTINIAGLVLCQLSEQKQEIYHYYDTIPGTIILILRIFIFFFFILGVNKSLIECSSSKIKVFIKKIGLIGTCYLLSWPLTVIIVEMTLPVYLHKDIINLVQQSVHLISCTILIYMISHPQSAYRKISLHEDDNPLKMNSYRNK